LHASVESLDRLQFDIRKKNIFIFKFSTYKFYLFFN